MRQSAITLARVLGFVEIADLVSGSMTSLGEIVRQLAARYSFEKFPKTFEEFDLGKGIEFLEGASDLGPIQKFGIWGTGLVVETRINTTVSSAIMEEILTWGSKELGIKYQSGSIKSFGYVSDVTFYSDAPLLSSNPAVDYLAMRTSEEISRIWQEPLKYEPMIVQVGHDPLVRKYTIAPFRIERRAERRFSENKYFSEAPLPTDIHWALLEEYENRIIGRGR